MKIRLLSLAVFVLFLIFSVGFFGGCASTKQQAAESNPLLPGGTTNVIYTGPVVGYNKALHPVTIPTFNQSAIPCPTFTQGDDNGYFFGWSYEHLLGEKVNSMHSIIGRVLFNSMPAFFKITNSDDYPSLIYNPATQGDTALHTSLDHTIKVNYTMITIEAMYKFMPFEDFGLGITIGPTFDFALSRTLTQQLSLNGPNNVQFRHLTQGELDSLVKIGQDYRHITYSSDSRTITVFDGTIENSKMFRLGMKVGIQYQQNLEGLGIIVPSVYYNFGITNLTSTPSWRVNAFQIGVDLRFAL